MITIFRSRNQITNKADNKKYAHMMPTLQVTLHNKNEINFKLIQLTLKGTKLSIRYFKNSFILFSNNRLISYFLKSTSQNLFSSSKIHARNLFINESKLIYLRTQRQLA